jgi:lipid II:glycine glycyltransferase (peptidoglycan interpeptide bridge formation enzyme)
VLDLTQPLDQILANMRSKTRKSVRQSQNRGLIVRRGGEDDLPVFYDLFMATADRKGFRDYSRSYFQQLWRFFGPDGHAQLFIAEKDGKPVAAALRLAFGQTVICKKRGWSGQFGELRPNEALEWAAIRWAKDAGYRFYDFEGLPRPIAESVLRGDGVPHQFLQSPANYKLGYGGDVCILPDSLAYFANPVLRLAHRVVYPKIAHWPIIDRIVSRVKVN